MPISEKLMQGICRLGSYLVYGTTEEANWIYEKIQRPSSYGVVAMNLLYWKLRRTRVCGIVGLMVEPVFGCNLRCAYCPWTWIPSRLEGIRPRLMTWETFRTVVDVTPKSVETIQLCGMGEPTLHPQLCEMIEYIAKKGMRPSLFTNGTLLQGDLVSRLARTPLAVLNVSIEPDAETCRQFRGIDIEMLRENVAQFVAVKQPTTEVKVRMVAHPGNAERLGKFWEQWRGLAQDVKIGPVFNLDGARRDFACMEPWRGNLLVLTDGGVSPCAIDCFQDLIIGNVHSQSFSEIINGPPHRNLLARFLNGNLFERCATCADSKVAGIPTLTPKIRLRHRKSP